ncbi:hypothetical protein K1719_019174 [Acacia pycnantha]|nr:hypothetical protein K1719_019174 [Acacia pycnantha]
MSKINMGTSASVTKDTKNKAFSGVLQKKFKLREQHKSLSRSIYITGGSWGATWYGIWAPSSSNLEVGNQVHQDDPVNEAVRDAFGVQDDNFTKRCGVRTVFFENDAAREFFSLMDESDRPLYQGCQKYSKLSFLIKLYHIKCMCGITDKAMSMFLELLRDAFPDADIPSSFYEAKKIINEIRLELRKIDAAQTIVCFIGERTIGGRLVRSVTLRGSRLFEREEAKKKLRRF